MKQENGRVLFAAVPCMDMNKTALVCLDHKNTIIKTRDNEHMRKIFNRLFGEQRLYLKDLIT